MREWLVMARQKMKLTQESVAREANISRAYYTQLELSQRDPSIRVAKELGRVLDFAWTRFFDETE